MFPQTNVVVVSAQETSRSNFTFTLCLHQILVTCTCFLLSPKTHFLTLRRIRMQGNLKKISFTKSPRQDNFFEKSENLKFREFLWFFIWKLFETFLNSFKVVGKSWRNSVMSLFRSNIWCWIYYSKKMAKKIPFSCVFASGNWNILEFLTLAKLFSLELSRSDEELPQYPASELNQHGPAQFGWRSKPDANCPAIPKEIVLKFHYPAKIYKIQVLAHQYLIRKWSPWKFFTDRHVKKNRFSFLFFRENLYQRNESSFGFIILQKMRLRRVKASNTSDSSRCRKLRELFNHGNFKAFQFQIESWERILS